jgi:hypothetical protein
VLFDFELYGCAPLDFWDATQSVSKPTNRIGCYPAYLRPELRIYLGLIS